MNSLIILGSTGSVGRQTLDVVRANPGALSVEALAVCSNTDLLIEQIREFSPSLVAVIDEASAKTVKAACGQDCRIFSGENALIDLIHAASSTCAVVAISGVAALKPVLTALELGKSLALANKECLVAGGDLCKQVLREKGGRIASVDSEHSSIFQLLGTDRSRKVSKIILTASGGPFLRAAWEVMAAATPAEAVKHPRWNMGAKISVDSATLMNKGLEVIEAAQLFDLPAEKIEVLIHTESIVHGLVEFDDGTVFACCSETDMKLPIAHALTVLCGCDLDAGVKRLSLAEWGALHFERPDIERFPALRLAYEALRIGGSAPAVLNGANEAAVSAFMAGRIGLLQIAEVVEEALRAHDVVKVDSLDTLLTVDLAARESAEKIIGRKAGRST